MTAPAGEVAKERNDKLVELARRVGLGLAARGDVSDCVGWAHDASRRGLESVWVHDSYFERDAVTYCSALAAQVPGLRIALGALNPFTRHPVLLAMTVSAIDQMAPGRVVLGLGTGLPLRLAQMGIPYSPDEGLARVAEAIDTVRALWGGERLPPGAEGVPPLQPMFPPVHHVPIYIAAYRSAMLEMAGAKADGYLARPAESIPSFVKMLGVIRAAATRAGRHENAVETAGYLLTLVGDSRRDALNRAKREPFVIYMMSVLSDVSLNRVGFDRSLRDDIAAAWRAEEYHKAAELVPDEMLDAFILCGTVEDVAAKAWDYHAAGMDVPVLQPVVQEDAQVGGALAAAELYASGAGSPAVHTALDASPAPPSRRWRQRAAAFVEIARPFSLTASSVPVAAGGALAAAGSSFSWPLFLLALVASVCLQLGTNAVNEVYDVRKGIDSITSPRASHAILKGRLTERDAFLFAAAAFGLATIVGVALIFARGWPVALLGLAGLLGGLGYTAPPLQYKYRALGLPLVFMLMGPLTVVGAYYVTTGAFDIKALIVSIPVGFLVAAILHGNEWRDISEDARAGIATASIRLGRKAAHLGYVSLVLGAYLALALAVMVGSLPPWSLLAMLSLPLLVRIIRASELGASGQQRAIAMIDLQTARLHATFGLLLVAGLAIAAAQ